MKGSAVRIRSSAYTNRPGIWPSARVQEVYGLCAPAAPHVRMDPDGHAWTLAFPTGSQRFRDRRAFEAGLLMAGRRPSVNQEPFHQVLPLLMAEEGISLRELARRADATAPHLSRLIRQVDYRNTPGPELLARIAEVFDLAPEHFVEYREARVVAAVKADASLRDRLFRQLPRD